MCTHIIKEKLNVKSESCVINFIDTEKLKEATKSNFLSWTRKNYQVKSGRFKILAKS